MTAQQHSDYQDALQALYSSLPYIPLFPEQDNELYKQKLNAARRQIEIPSTVHLNHEERMLLSFLLTRELLSLEDAQTQLRLRHLLDRHSGPS